MDSFPIETVELGRTGIQIPVMGVGAWAWGDRIFWGFGGKYSDQEVRSAFDASISVGMTFFDTAETYGNGMSERFLGRFVNELQAVPAGKKLFIATKFFPFPWRLWKGTLVSALKKSLGRLQMEQIDLYQIHQPFSILPLDTRANELAQAVKEGLTRTVGVSNYSAAQTRRTFDVLEHEGVPLASNQVEYSLLNRKIENNGILDTCRELGVTIIAYSPIAKGVLTGKYTPQSPPPGLRGKIYSRDLLERAQPLLNLMREIGRSHQSKSLSQVALNWTICKGTVPIPGAKNARQAEENAGALGWRLTDAEVTALDQASDQILAI